MQPAEFCARYTELVESLELVLLPELLRKLYVLDPHDLIHPELFILNESHAIGIICCVAARLSKGGK